jgi:hypothetical protein
MARTMVVENIIVTNPMDTGQVEQVLQVVADEQVDVLGVVVGLAGHTDGDEPAS